MMHHTYAGNKDKRRSTLSSWKDKPVVVLSFAAVGLVVFLLVHALVSSVNERSLAEGQQHQQQRKSSDPMKIQATSFDQLVHMTYTMSSTPVTTATAKQQAFALSEWKRNKPNGGGGGLQGNDDDDSILLLAKIYGNAESVFEFGLGESTLLANHLGVPRYVGLDSDPSYIPLVREKVASHFRFMWADTGKTDVWGRPVDKLLPKNVYNYQIAPLMTEYKAFDVYMVNGRWQRLPCMLASFLHASAREMEAKGLTLPLDQTYDTHTIVVLHDCVQEEGHSPSDMEDRARNREIFRADHLLDLIDHSGQQMYVYKRKPTTSDQDLLAVWMNNE